MSHNTTRVGLSLFFAGLRDQVKGIWCIIEILLKHHKNSSKDVHQENRSTQPKSVLEQRRLQRTGKPVLEKRKKEKPLATTMSLFLLFHLVFGVLYGAILYYLVMPQLQAELGESESAFWRVLYVLINTVIWFAWIIPMILISRIMTFCWFDEISDQVYKEYRRGKVVNSLRLSEYISDTGYSCLVQIVATVLLSAFVTILNWINMSFLGVCIEVGLSSLLCAFYAFEYAWYYEGLDIRNRIRRIEQNWPYYFAFGLPVSFAHYAIPAYIIRYPLAAILYAIGIISAIIAPRPTATFPYRVRVFQPGVFATYYLFRASSHVASYLFGWNRK